VKVWKFGRRYVAMLHGDRHFRFYVGTSNDVSHCRGCSTSSVLSCYLWRTIKLLTVARWR